MTIEEIFIKLASHMQEGVKMHEDMARIYEFMGLVGFAKLHRYQCCEENNGY